MTRRRGVLAIAAAALLALIATTVACSDDDTGGTDGAGTSITPASSDAAYLAIGDSITAGGGAPPYDGPIGEACAQSTRAWPYVLSELDPALPEPELRACGGATVEHLLGPWVERDQPAQVPNRSAPEVELVTFTIGGNDTAVGTFIAFCVPEDCAAVSDTAAFTTVLRSFTTKLVDDVYPDLRRAFPNARLVHVGYPILTPAAGEPLVGCPWMSPAEQAVSATAMSLVNEAIRTATEQATEEQVLYVDVSDALAGHEICTQDPWVNAAETGADAFHPTAEGYAAMAALVAEALS